MQHSAIHLTPEELSLTFHLFSEPWTWLLPLERSRSGISSSPHTPPSVPTGPFTSLPRPHPAPCRPAATTWSPGSMRAKPSSAPRCSTRRKATPSTRRRWARAGRAAGSGAGLRAALISSRPPLAAWRGPREDQGELRVPQVPDPAGRGPAAHHERDLPQRLQRQHPAPQGGSPSGAGWAPPLPGLGGSCSPRPSVHSPQHGQRLGAAERHQRHPLHSSQVRPHLDVGHYFLGLLTTGLRWLILRSIALSDSFQKYSALCRKHRSVIFFPP